MCLNFDRIEDSSGQHLTEDTHACISVVPLYFSMDTMLVISDSMLRCLEGMVAGAIILAFGGAEVEDLIYNITQDIIPCITIANVHIIYIHAGTNEISKGREGNILWHMSRLVLLLRSINPNAHIVVGSILPRLSDFYVTNATVETINTELRDLCRDHHNVHFHRSYRPFILQRPLRADRRLYSRRDWFHLSAEGRNQMILLIANVICLWQQNRLVLLR